MNSYPKTAVERATRVQEMRLAKKDHLLAAAEIIGVSDRSMRRWWERYEQVLDRKINLLKLHT